MPTVALATATAGSTAAAMALTLQKQQQRLQEHHRRQYQQGRYVIATARILPAVDCRDTSNSSVESN
jgi:hypothetical protein